MERKFLDFSLPGANVLRNESFTGAKVLSMVFSLPGTKVQRNEKASYHFATSKMRLSIALHQLR